MWSALNENWEGASQIFDRMARWGQTLNHLRDPMTSTGRWQSSLYAAPTELAAIFGYRHL